MSSRRKTALVLLLAAGAVFSLAWSNLHVCRWASEAESGFATYTACPETFGPSSHPEGDFVVAIEAPEGLRKPLIKYLQQEIPKIGSGTGRLLVVRDAGSFVPGEGAPEESNMLYVGVTASLIWTPVYARFTDTTVVKFSNRYISNWAGPAEDVIVVESGEVRVEGEHSGAGKGFGLIGRAHADAFHAKLLGDFVMKTIADTYARIRDAASKPATL